MTNKTEQEELLELLEAKEAAVKYNKITTLFPDNGPYRRELYPRHVDFINASAQFSQLAFIAGNRVGKTLTGACIMTYHLTGKYPAWYKGRKFLSPVNCWAVGVTNQSTKEIQQYELLGDITDVGSGTLPKDLIEKTTKKPGVADAIETIYVKHISGGLSKVTFKSYEQGRDSFQGTKKQVIWLDEEPQDKGIYSECLTRTMDQIAPGYIYCTFTPLFGLSDIVLEYVPDGRFPTDGIVPNGKGKYVVRVEWDDVPHISEQQKEEMLAAYSPHERVARSKGIPSLGSGAIYPYPEDELVVRNFLIPNYWPRAYGLDVGWNKTAAVWIAQNPDTKQIFVYSEHYQSESIPAIHASAIKSRGNWICGAIDPASKGHSQVDGKALLDLYVAEDLNLVPANNSVEAGIAKVQQLFASGQLEIFADCTNLISEIRTYKRDEKGKVVKKNDHALDALRYAIISGLDLLSIPPDEDAERYRSSSSTSSGRDELTGY